MNPWIPFHASLREGDKRGLPRAVRFVYLELSLLSRPFEGDLPLPRGFKSDIDALHDMLGGKRSEIVETIDLLTVPMDPTNPDDEPLLRLSGPPSRRVLTVTSHKNYVSRDKSTTRVRRHRKNQSEQLQTDEDVWNAFQDPSETALKDKREENKRLEKSGTTVSRPLETGHDAVEAQSGVMPVARPAADPQSAPAEVTVTAKQLPVAGSRTAPSGLFDETPRVPASGATKANVAPAAKPRGRSSGVGTRLTSEWTASPALIAWSHGEGVDGAKLVDEFKDHWVPSTKPDAWKLDWDAAFRTWVRRGKQFGTAPKWVPPPYVRPAKEDAIDAAAGEATYRPGLFDLNKIGNVS